MKTLLRVFFNGRHGAQPRHEPAVYDGAVLLIEGGCQSGGRWMGVEDADLISDLLDLEGKGLRQLDEMPESTLLSSLLRLLDENDGTAPAFYGFQNMMIARRMDPPAPS